MKRTERLPEELRRLVSHTTAALGQVIQSTDGSLTYRRVESYRMKLKETRGQRKQKKLEVLLGSLKKETPAVRLGLAYAFSLQLELVNCCEAAYRTWRVRQRPIPQALSHKTPINLVLTAHPTEARSIDTVRWLNELTSLLIDGLQKQMSFDEAKLQSLIRLLWQRSMTKAHKPSVTDEADYIFSLALSDESLQFLLTDHPQFDLRLRTWVGGDKDGHPLVNKQVMTDCLQRSRARLSRHLASRFHLLIRDAVALGNQKRVKAKDIQDLHKLHGQIRSLQTLKLGDGQRILKFKHRYQSLLQRLESVFGQHHQKRAIDLLWVKFPALVLPIEMREDSALIQSSLQKTSSPIRQMLTTLAKLAGPLKITSYARGLVISRCESSQDLAAACDLIRISTRGKSLPAIPLFESGEALRAGPDILKEWLSQKTNRDLVTKHWSRRFEIMLGYSDSAKQVGVLPSRFLLSKTMGDLERTLKKYRLQPIFFHGSGGSVDRGGGSLKEQISWWTHSAAAAPKLTIQGEMIQRWFANSEILNSQCSHLAEEVGRRKSKQILSSSPTLQKFAGIVEGHYRRVTSDANLMEQLLNATPYNYLEVLQIGSRPSKRAGKDFSLSALRAIPWVLCWTQTRVLLPTWWGLGSAWKSLSKIEQAKLRRLAKTDEFFSSFLKTLGFSLAKVEMEIWDIYLQRVGTDRELARQVRLEYAGALRFIRSVTGKKDLIWHRPWLEESIWMRNPHIHILNLLQIHALNESDEDLMRASLVGIACGMLTTG